MLNLRIIDPASAEPITLAEARLQCKVDPYVAGTDSPPTYTHPDDALITGLIRAARGHAERYTRMNLTDASYEYRCPPPYYGGGDRAAVLPGQGGYGDPASVNYFEGYPGPQGLRVPLPMGPVWDVVSVKYLDVDEVEQTLSPAVYFLNDDPWAPTVGLKKGQAWPAMYWREDAFRITFTGGPTLENPVPLEMVQAMKLMIGHWYRNREDATVAQMYEIPLGAKVLMMDHRRGMGV
jgi:hypothetical protein